jgi:hypothetical protein
MSSSSVDKISTTVEKSKVNIRDIILGVVCVCVLILVIKSLFGSSSGQQAPADPEEELIVPGPAANSLRINASSGLYSYIPAYWYGSAKYTVGGQIRWSTKNNRGILLNPSDDRQILCPIPGLYEFNLSGSMFSNKTDVQNMNMNVNGSIYLAGPVYYTGFIGWRAVSLNNFVVVTNTTTYITYTMGAGLETSVNAPTILTVKYISL